MELDPTLLTEQQIYNFMMSSILPRPIAWISTVDASGNQNLAPFAYFMGVCCIPMTILFCPVAGAKDRPKKDTLLNIEQVPEFVVNVSSEQVIEAVNLSAAPLPKGQSEFELTGMTPLPSSIVRPPRVGEAAVSFECKVRDVIEISNAPGGGWVVLGTVVKIHAREEMLDPSSFILDRAQLRPVGRLGGADFVRTNDTFSLRRYKSMTEVDPLLAEER